MSKFIFKKYSQALTDCLSDVKKIDKKINYNLESAFKYVLREIKIW